MAGIKVLHWDDVVPSEVTETVIRRVAVGKNMLISRWELKAGSGGRPAHSHHNEQIDILIKGSVRVTLEGVEYTAEAGDFVILPSGVVHGPIFAIEDSIGLSVFSPVREEYVPK